MDLDLERFTPVPSETEPGMNLISADFDLIMVNRVNERLYGKPMVEMLGKKCYREFEKREAPCPHCPGRLSLITGQSHAAETEGIRDDGTWFSARVRTHPVQGPGDKPTGFIEVVEDTTEEKRAEKLAQIDEDLQDSLSAADTVQKALLHCLDAALRVESIDAGGVFTIDWVKRRTTLVQQRNLSADFVAALEAAGLESAMSGELPAHVFRVGGTPLTGELVPIAHRGQRVAVVVVGGYTYPSIPASLRAGLHSLGATAGNAISRILAERSRGDAVADLEAFITIAPLATWLVDSEGRLTMWNRAAERLLGWRSSEIMGRRPPFDLTISEPALDGSPCSGREVTLLAKDGTPVDARVTIAPFRDIVGNASASIVMAEDLSLQRRLAALETDAQKYAPWLRGSGDSSAESCATADQSSVADPRLLVVDPDVTRGAEVIAATARLGWEAVACGSFEEAVGAISDACAAGLPFSAVLVELLSTNGPSGLELKTRLRCVGVDTPIVVCSDAHVLGYEFHGFAGSVKRPHDDEDLKQAITHALHGA
jgi:PAS domain S-box-containing protein